MESHVTIATIRQIAWSGISLPHAMLLIMLAVGPPSDVLKEDQSQDPEPLHPSF